MSKSISNNIISPVMEKLFDKFAAKFTSELNGIVENLTKNFVDSHCEPLKQKISALELENKQLQARMDDIENNQRSDNLIIHGLAETIKEDNSTEREIKAAISTEIVSDAETVIDESQLKDQDLSGGETRASSRQSVISSADSEGVIMPHGKTQRSAAQKPNGLDSSDVVTIVVSHVSLDENSPLLTDDNVRMLFVEYHFLGVPLEETETPYSLPKPTAPNKPISFNFTKVFHVDYDNNYERRQYLGGMLLPDDPDNGRIRFTIVSEPLDEDDEDCSDVGSAYVSIPKILENGADVINEEVPIYDINDESRRIGVLGVSVQCLAALRVIERQLRTETMTS